MFRTNFLYPSKTREIAAGKVQSDTPGGKRQAIGDITFSAIPVVTENFTINGTVFTAMTAGAAGNQFNLGVSLTLSLDALVTVLNASAVAAVAKATYSNVGGTKLHVVYDTYGAEGNAFTLAESCATATVSGATLTGGADADKVDLDAQTKALVTAAGTTVQEWDLPAGEEGQETCYYLKTKGAGANAQVNGAFVGGTKITLDTAGKMFTAKFLNGSWQPLVNTGTLA